MTRTRPAALIATVVAFVSLGPALGLAPAALAAPGTTLTKTDPVDAGASYDIVELRAKAAREPGGRATVVVLHDRRVRAGDGIDVWFDLDGDREPDVYLTGLAYSEYAVYRTRSFAGHGADVSDRGCYALKMSGRRATVRFDPSCLGEVRAFAVTARSFRHGEPAVGADWVPRKERFTRRVLATVPIAQE
jgi:hypothetical protein